MDISTLKSKNRTTVTWMGESVCIRKIAVADYLDAQKIIASVGDAAKDDDAIANAEWLAFIASKCLVSGDDRPFDSDEGRAALRDCSLADLNKIVDMCVEFSGLGDQKKS
jgi:hypothetical protein